MKNIAIKLLIIASVFGGTLVFNACDEGYRINTKKMIQDEQDLMEDYLQKEVNDSMTVKDTLTEISSRVVDSMESEGFLFFELRKGSTDTVRIGKEVGYRFNLFEIARDSAGTPEIYFGGSNFGSDSPLIYTAGNPDVRRGVYAGIDQATRLMSRGSKARVFVSSSLWTNDYRPRVIDIEVTYVEK